jgi:riboflavin biosynthesis pyrimidine reductase
VFCLVDEFIFVVQPDIAGEGRGLFEGISLQEKLLLTFIESKTLKSGCVALHYGNSKRIVCDRSDTHYYGPSTP